MLKIVTAPNDVLSCIAKPVAKVDSSIRKLIKDMKEALDMANDPKGVGLAASQVGKPLQIFLAKPTENSKIFVFINPKLITDQQQSSTVARRSKAKNRKLKSIKLEGCLSLENIWGEVKRNPTVKISYLDEAGKKHIEEFKGLLATIIQHEIDHLNGVLFPKRVLEQKGTLYKSHRNKQSEDEFEEIEI